MASKKQMIVIKKITVSGGGHHGGSWKVAFADFMTALMAFFLVMWLIGQNEETKKAISDYFSTPSMVEYNYENFGAEITIEKLFLDFVNEPIKAVQSFFEPADRTPNLLDLGSTKIIAAYMADKMTDIAKNVNITQDIIEFDIPDTYLFEKGTAQPVANFVPVIEKLVGVTMGLKDADVKLVSALFIQAVPDQNASTAEKVAQARLDLVKNKIAATFEHTSNTINGSINVKDKKGEFDPAKLIGFIRVQLKQKETAAKNKKVSVKAPKKDDGSTDEKNRFNAFANEALKAKREAAAVPKPASGEDPNLVNPVDQEIRKLSSEAEPAADN